MEQAFDLVDYKYVACKLHRLNEQWSKDKKETYIRHAMREVDIHKSLVHCHIVRLWGIFEIDHNTFCTVLEYCSGKILCLLSTLLILNILFYLVLHQMQARLEKACGR